MKKLLATLFSLLISFSSYSNPIISDNENFVVLGKSDSFTLLVNPDSIIERNLFRFSKTVSIFTKEDSQLVENKLVKSIVKFSQHDCKNKKVRILWSLYLDPKLELLESFNSVSEWFTIETGTIGFLEHRFVCDKKIKTTWT